MPTAYCPRCRGTKETRVTVTYREEKVADGKLRRVETQAHHCQECNGFVYSEDREAPKAA